MIAYSYNSETNEYIGTTPCQLDPLATKLYEKEIYLLPADATFVEVPEHDVEHEVAVWTGKEWKIKQKETPNLEENIEQTPNLTEKMKATINSVVNLI